VHGSTFGGNPLACAAGLAAIGAIETEQLPGQAVVKGQYLMAQLRKIQSSQIREIRGLGLMVGIELKSKAMPYIRALQHHKILALNAGLTVIRLLPPLVITTSQLDQVVAAIAEVLALDPSQLER
jgi:LysW-gamma-L-lysine/LysW-L-ornithine aminotransferase